MGTDIPRCLALWEESHSRSTGMPSPCRLYNPHIWHGGKKKGGMEESVFPPLLRRHSQSPREAFMRVGYKMTVEASRSPSKPRLQRLRMAFHHHACLPEGAISSPRCRPDGGGGRTTKTYRPPERHNGWLIVNTNRGYIGSPFQRDCCFS